MTDRDESPELEALRERIWHGVERTYRAELPWTLSPEFIEDLRRVGKVRMILEVDAPSRADAIRTLGDEYEWRGMDRDYWNEHLSGKRSRS